MPFLAINSHQVFYEVAGDGAPVTVLHHATASSRNWRALLPLLAVQFRVLSYDRPGFGRSSWLDEWPLDYLDRDVEDLIALLDALGVARTALVGHSDGAALALMAAARHPQRVGCVLAEAPHVAVETPRCPDAVQAFAAQVASSAALQEALARDHGARGGQVVQRWADRWLDPAFWSWDVSGELGAVACPVLVVHGADDPFFSQQHAAMIARRVVNGTLCVIPGAAHVPHNEAREPFVGLAFDFLRQCAGEGAAW